MWAPGRKFLGKRDEPRGLYLMATANSAAAAAAAQQNQVRK